MTGGQVHPDPRGPVTRIRRALLVSAASGTALAATAGGASAITINVPDGLCDEHTFSTPFAALGDTAAYTRVPGGAFEGALDGWVLTGAVKTIRDRVDNLGAGGDQRALKLPADASATTPLMCVTTDYPYFRFFARATSSANTSRLRAEVIYEATTPATVIPVGTLYGSKMTSWQATPQLRTGVILATIAMNVAKTQQILSGDEPVVGAGPMRIRLTATGGAWEVDDLFVDPRMR